MTMTLISTITATGSTGTIGFTNIPETYTDLLLVASVRTPQAVTYTTLYSYFGTALAAPLRTGYNSRSLLGTGSGTSSVSQTNDSQWNFDNIVPGSSATANTFGSVHLYLPNYASSLPKSVSLDGVSESNSAASGQLIHAGSNAHANSLSPITYWAIELNSNNFVAGSTAYLYGILKGSGGATVS